MRFSSILLINPLYPSSRYDFMKRAFPNIGLGYVAEMLKTNGIDYHVVDMALGHTVEDVVRQIKDYRADLVGMSMMTFQYKTIYTWLERIKSECSEVAIVAGGSHVCSQRAKVLEQCHAIDYGVVGEGEYTLLELCKGEKAVRDIKGLLFRKKNQVSYAGDRELIQNLDELPFPKYDHFELAEYSDTMALCSSRGCPYQCIFCESHLLGKKFRARSAVTVVDEIQYWYEKGYRHFHFQDDNFTLSKNRVYEICDEVGKRGLVGLSIDAVGVKVDRVDRQLLERMREVGFIYLAFGVESGNERVLKALKKRQSVAEVEKAIKDATELGFTVKLYMLVGSPYETFSDFKDSVALALKYPVKSVGFSNLTPLPNTELFEWVKSNGRLLKDPDNYLNLGRDFGEEPMFVGPGMSLEERKEAWKLAQKTRDFIENRWWWQNRLAQSNRTMRFLARPFMTSRLIFSLRRTFLARLLIRKAQAVLSLATSLCAKLVRKEAKWA